MENNMKYIKLYENFENDSRAIDQYGVFISDEDWELFKSINRKYGKMWERKYLRFDFKDNKSLIYTNYLTLGGRAKLLSDCIPEGLRIKRIRGDLYIRGSKLVTLKGFPDVLHCDEIRIHRECQKLVSLDGLTINTTIYNSYPRRNHLNIIIEDSNIQSFKGLDHPSFSEMSINLEGSIKVLLSCKYLVPLIKNDNVNKILMDFDNNMLSREEFTDYLKSLYPTKSNVKFTGFFEIEKLGKLFDLPNFSLPIWFEALAFVGAWNIEVYKRICSNYPKETTFTQEQVEEIYRSDLIDYESTLADAVAVGLPVPQEIMNRTKKYDHSEYRDSKLDSEWKEIF